MSQGFEDVRQLIADTISDDSQYQTFPWPPASPMPNMVTLEPADPWITFLGLNRTMMSNWVIKMYAAVNDNRNDLVTLENMVTTILQQMPTWAIMSEVSAPNTLELNNTLLTVCDVQISVPINLEE